MAKTAFTIDTNKWPEDLDIKPHNRWYPDIPMVETFKPGDEFRVECYDWTGGQIANDNSADDIRDVDLSNRISARALPGECPTCGRTASRVLKAPFLNTMAKNRRIAHQHNERSANEPRVENQPVGVPMHQGHNVGRHRHPPSRPWMIGH